MGMKPRHTKRETDLQNQVNTLTAKVASYEELHAPLIDWANAKTTGFGPQFSAAMRAAQTLAQSTKTEEEQQYPWCSVDGIRYQFCEGNFVVEYNRAVAGNPSYERRCVCIPEKEVTQLVPRLKGNMPSAWQRVAVLQIMTPEEFAAENAKDVGCERCDKPVTNPDETHCDDCLCELANEEYDDNR